MIGLRFKKLCLSLLCLLGLFISYDVIGMDDKDIPEYLKSQQSEEVAAFIQALNKQIKPQCNADEILVYSIDPNEFISEGVCFSQDIFNLSRTLKEMKDDIHLEELKEAKEVKIHQSNSAIKAAHTILIAYFNGKDELSKKKNIENLIKKYSFDQLIDGANCIEFLGCDLIIRDIICDEIKQRIRQDGSIIKNKKFAELNSDLQKLLMVESIKKWLKKLIIEKYAQQRKKTLITQALADHLRCFMGLAFSSDDRHIFFGDMPSPGDVTTCDLKGDILSTFHADSRIYSLVLSPNGKYVAYAGMRQNLHIREIASGKITELVGLFRYPSCIAFSPNGTKIVAGSGSRGQNNLVLWDIENIEAVTSTVLDKISKSGAFSVAFNHDGTQIVVEGWGNITIGDVSTNSVIAQDNQTFQNAYGEVRFNSDGTQIICSGQIGDNKVLALCNIVDDEKNKINCKKMRKQAINEYGEIYYSPILRRMTHERHEILLNPKNKREMISINYKDGNNSILLWDIGNYDEITYYVIPGSDDAYYSSAALSHDGMKLITGSIRAGFLGKEYAHLTLWTLLTKEENEMLEKIKDYDSVLIRSLYQLCLAENPIKNEDLVYLPNNMKKLLSDLLWPSDPIRPDDDISGRVDPELLYAPLDLLPNTYSLILPDFINRWIAKTKAWLNKKPQ